MAGAAHPMPAEAVPRASPDSGAEGSSAWVHWPKIGPGEEGGSGEGHSEGEGGPEAVQPAGSFRSCRRSLLAVESGVRCPVPTKSKCQNIDLAPF